MVRLLTLYLAAGVEVGAAVIVGFAAGEAIIRAGRGLLKGDTSDILRMIADPKTPADHEAIAEYCDRQATEAEASGQLHEAMAQRYPEMRTHPRWETPEHCVKIAQYYEGIAQQDSELAAAHRALAQQTH